MVQLTEETRKRADDTDYGASMSPRALTALLSSTASVFVTAASVLVSPGALPAQELFRRGNTNGDGALDISDAIAVFSYLFLGGAEPPCLDAADSNDDGVVDISDGVFLLSHLFQGGPEPPAPSGEGACGGPDPTPDALGCDEGIGAGSDPPSARLWAVVAPPPGVRQRSRITLPQDPGGAFVVGEGHAFALLLEATRNLTSRAGFSLADPEAPDRGNPATLLVVCDRDLGDLERGGVPAGENLARFFLNDVDLWEDRIYLLEHAALRIAGDSPWSPAPGLYRLSARVIDDECAASAEVEIELRVAPSTAPEVFGWLEATSEVRGDPLPHDAGSGNARTPAAGGYLLVVETGANPHGGPAPLPGGLVVTADPPFGPGADLSAFVAPDPGQPGRYFLRLGEGLSPPLGNTNFTIRAEAEGGVQRSVEFVVEVRVPYAAAIQPIWTASCTGCHERPIPEQGLELVNPDPSVTRRNIVHVFATQPPLSSVAPRLVRPYLPQASYLFHKLRGTHADPAVGGDGERMPLGGGFLDGEAMRIVESWIVQGAGE
jgi:hypothetical protein